MRTILGEGDVDKITYYVTPRALAKCETNALLMAITVSRKNRKVCRMQMWACISFESFQYFRLALSLYLLCFFFEGNYPLSNFCLFVLIVVFVQRDFT